jgi:hypothetical protein
MPLPRRITADGAAALLLGAAAAVLVATPYDGGACRNVVAAYALPAASLGPADQPGEPAGLADARQAVTTAQGAVDALTIKKADVDKAQQAAQQARAAADKAELGSATDTSSIDASVSVDQAQSDVDIAQSEVSDDQSMLQTDQQDAADFPGESYWTQQVQQAQSQLTADQAKLSAAQQAYQKAQGQASSSAAAAKAAQQNADSLSAQADAAEKTAEDAATNLAAQQSDAERSLSAAQSEEARQESDYRATVAGWSHERRMQGDHVVALNNVRSSCRESGTWRAAAAGADVVLLAALAVLRWAHRLRRVRIRVPWLPVRLRRRS